MAAIDWSTDPYVRVYTRETEDDKFLSWEARAIWKEFLCRCDTSGLVTVSRGARGLAKLLDIPADVVGRALPELLEDGRIRVVAQGFIAPNYVVAQFTPRADKARAAQARAAKSLLGREAVTVGQGAISAQGVPGDGSGQSFVVGQGEPPCSQGVPDEGDTPSRDVTQSHATSHAVTPRHLTTPDQIKADQNRSSQRARAMRGADDEPSATPIREDWQPSAASVALAAELEISNLPLVVGEFIRFWQRSRKAVGDWDTPFQERLYQLARQRGERSSTEAATPKKTTWL